MFLQMGGVIIGTRSNKDIEKYNNAAAEMLYTKGVEIDDLYRVSLALRYSRPDRTHFSVEGYKELSEAVVESIKESAKKEGIIF